MTDDLLRGAACALLALTGCIELTPFGVDVERENLNSKNLGRLRESPTLVPARFAAFGDSHHDYDGLADVIGTLNRRSDLGLLVHLGDFSNSGLLQEYEWTDRALSTSSAPVFVILGNHDCLSSGPDIYRRMYGPFDFSFTWAGHRFVFFNSNTLEFDSQVPDRAWLERELTQLEEGERAILVTHQAPVSSESAALNGLEQFYRRLLREYDVALWVHAHDHDFQLYTLESTPVLQSSPVSDLQAYAIVTLSPGIAIERCRDGACEPVEPEPE